MARKLLHSKPLVQGSFLQTIPTSVCPSRLMVTQVSGGASLGRSTPSPGTLRCGMTRLSW